MSTTTSKAHADTWMGLSPTGKPVQIDHEKLMTWAFRNEQQFTVAWSSSFTDNKGNRLVRGDHVAEARMAGWDDIADALDAFFRSNDSRADKELTV